MSTNEVAPTRIYVDMVADLFHRGHLEFIRAARSIAPGDIYLIVGIHSDDTCSSYKRKPVFSMDDRVSLVGSCCYVDEVIKNAPLKITEEFLREYQIDYVVHGDDMNEFMNECYKVPRDKGVMRYVPYYPGISTSSIIKRISDLCKKDPAYADSKYKRS